MDGDPNGAAAAVREALEAGADPFSVVEEGLSRGMDRVGEKFEAKEFFLPELFMAAEAVQAAVELLKPYLSRERRPTKARVIVGTVEGDFHDIGKNLVIASLEAAGYMVRDLGVDVSAERFARAAADWEADVVAVFDAAAEYAGIQVKRQGLPDL